MRKATAKVTPGLDEQFITGRLYGKSSSVTFYFKRNTNCVLDIFVKGYLYKTLPFHTFIFFSKLAFHQDLVKVVDVMVMSWKARNLSSTSRKLGQRKASKL